MAEPRFVICRWGNSWHGEQLAVVTRDTGDRLLGRKWLANSRRWTKEVDLWRIEREAYGDDLTDARGRRAVAALLAEGQP